MQDWNWKDIHELDLSEFLALASIALLQQRKGQQSQQTWPACDATNLHSYPIVLRDFAQIRVLASPVHTDDPLFFLLNQLPMIHSAIMLAYHFLLVLSQRT